MVKEVADSKSLIDDFISSRVTAHGLDGRTEKAYRMDLENFYAWAEQENIDGTVLMEKRSIGTEGWEDWMEAYLEYLDKERRMSFSTLCRKNKVLGYYLAYLTKRGIVRGCRSLKPVALDKKNRIAKSSQSLLSKREADAFFQAMEREYEGLDSKFRRRICLRDMVIMKLLFYHKIEISEVLRINISDYDQETGTLRIRRKKGQDYSICLYSKDLQRKIGLWMEERKNFQKREEYFDRLFLSKLGKPLSMEMVIQIFDKYRKLAGIRKKLTPKDLKENCMKQYARDLVLEKMRG